MKKLFFKVTFWFYMYVLFSFLTVLWTPYFFVGDIWSHVTSRLLFVLFIFLLTSAIFSWFVFTRLIDVFFKSTVNINNKDSILRIQIWVGVTLCIFTFLVPTIAMLSKHGHNIMSTGLSFIFIPVYVGLVYKWKKEKINFVF